MKTNDIKKVIDAGLANVQTTPQDVENIMNHIRESESRERKPRKMPLAVAIALSLLLIGAVAVAAMSFKGAIVEIFQIESQEQTSAISTWSFEHKMEVVDLLVSSGTSFDDDMLTRIYGNELSEEEKSDLIDEMLLKRFPDHGLSWSVTTLSMLVSEKGLPHTWTHEERVWYHETFVSMPMDEFGAWRYVLPTEEDMSEEQALEIAFDHYEKYYDLSRDCFDPDQVYPCFMEILLTDQAYPSLEDMAPENLAPVRVWTIYLTLAIDEYNGQEIVWPDMQMSIRPDGTLFDVTAPGVRTWEDDWNDTRNAENFWTIEGLYAFELEWKSRVEQLIREGESVDKMLKYLITKSFGMPQEGDISVETAREIARLTIIAQDDWTEEMLTYYTYREAYYIAEPNQYCILYTLSSIPLNEYWDTIWDMNDRGEIPYSIRVCIDAKTGEVLELYQLDRATSIIDTTGI